jgi:signal transduction histidine kinase
VYFLVGEAMANAARHASPRSIFVDIRWQAGLFMATVGDDGSGGARIVAGGGLAGLADRVEALGGTFQVRSPTDLGPSHPRGTTVAATFAVNR